MEDFVSTTWPLLKPLLMMEQGMFRPAEPEEDADESDVEEIQKVEDVEDLGTEDDNVDDALPEETEDLDLETDDTKSYDDETQNLIKEAVCQLPTKCQTIFKKSREEHKSNQEIADEMNISIKTVEAHITAALKSIRKKLGEKYYYLF